MSHITVTPADDDEVIVAGAGIAAEPEPEPGCEPEPARELELEPEPEPAPSAEPASRDAYRQAVADDLESPPMPIAQRIVIVAAVVCIIGALVYYFVAMR